MARRSFPRLLAIVATLLALMPAAMADPSSREQLKAARSWGYNLQKLDLAVLQESPYDVLVIDYARDGTEDTRLQPADLARLRKKPDGTRRVVLAYMSIGEAETYRYYWHWTWGGTWWTSPLGVILAPSWLSPSNGEWAGNYAVRYWDERWQTIIAGKDGYVSRIAAAGFDGVYLDKIDSSIEPVARRRATALDDMRAFVARIAKAGEALRPGFLVVPQNGEELLTDARYRSVIDGLAKEDLLYGEEGDKKPNPEPTIARRVSLLSLLHQDGKPVFAVEYIDHAVEIEAARRRLTGFGFIPHFADRQLDSLRIGDLPPAGHTPTAGSRRWRTPWTPR